MSDLVQVIAVAFSLALLALVLELVRRRKLIEEYSFIWIACAVALLVLSMWRDILHIAARTLGVHYPPALLLLVLTAFVFLSGEYEKQLWLLLGSALALPALAARVPGAQRLPDPR